MSTKILIVSDVHIGSYATKNTPDDPDYRLHQGSRIVPENIIKVGKETGCDYIAFAGDVIEKSILRPYVMAEVKRFLDRVMSEFKGGWLIYGNHCLDSKSSSQDINDSLLGMILPPNLKYAHQTIETIEGTTIGFSNFQPVFDLSWIPGKVDILITHATICYTPSEFIKSQELDESKFDLAFCGDIHKTGTIGKYVSIGIPQKCKMSDSDESTGIVFDCSTKEWGYVNLNPDDNLMKFCYTDNKDLHGWDKDTNTWLVYKPLIAKNGNGIISVETAERQVESLFNQFIEANGLVHVHSEVFNNTKNIDAGGIDFDFTLTKFWCKDWRSIEEATIYFDRGDKILIVGENGAGKTSLTSAIKYAFADTGITKNLSSLKSFIRKGAKDCVTEVEFVYQGANYRLRRGTKEFGLWINDVPQKYSDKKSFEADARERFPFIPYIGVFFLDADHNQLIGGMSPEQKSLIISKFFKLDKIDTLHDTAVFMLKLLDSDGAEWRNKIGRTEEILRFITSKLSEIEPPAISKENLEQSRWQGLEIQRKSTEWSSFVTRSSSLTGSKTATTNRINELAKQVTEFRAIETINQEITSLQAQHQDLQTQLGNLSSLKVRLEYKQKEIQVTKDEGNNAYRELMSLSIGKVCSTCGQVIQTTEALQEHQRELEKKISETGPKLQVLNQELATLQQEWDNSSNIYGQVNSQISTINSQISQLLMEKGNQTRIFNEIEAEKLKLQKINDELAALIQPEEVYLPERFMETMTQIENQISLWNSYNSFMTDYKKSEEDLKVYQSELAVLEERRSGLQAYVNLTGPTGNIYYEILKTLGDQFTDNTVQYVVDKYEKRGEHLNLKSSFNNNGDWIEYDACSSGQKTVLDVHFLQKIVSSLGILVMDEFLKHLSPANHDVCLDMISEMSIGCIMLSTHLESVAAFNNRTCRVKLNDHRVSEIDIK